MDVTTVIIVAIVLVAVNVFAVYFLSRRSAPKAEDIGLKLLLEQMNELSRTVDAKMGETTKEVSSALRHQFGESQKLIKDVTQGLTKLDETNKQVISFADQLQNLQDILKNPKQRGILGEYYLETLLKNVLPPESFKMQYTFPDGVIVDAAVFVKDKVIPVDSKFSLENYNRMAESKDPIERDRLQRVFENDLKNRIIETSKYIQPEHKTTDFAFMFIPHEAIYYDLLVGRVGTGDENLIQRAAGKYHVIIVSPTSFLAYLQTVLQGLKGMEIEEKAKELRVAVEKMIKHFQGYGEYHEKLGNALATTINHYNASGKAFGMLQKDVKKVTDGTTFEYETKVLEKPSGDD
ncbi:MAG TPA: DNA recombination protein RmuC [Candidatus Paceibacterota bacterium]